VAAFVLDLLCGAGLAVVSGLIAWLWLLFASSDGTRPPSDTAIYVGIALALLWLPVWAALTLLAWCDRGQSLGLAALGLRVDAWGRALPVGAALSRLLVLIFFTLLLALGLPLALFAGAAAAVGTIPVWLAALGFLPVVFGALDVVVWLARRDGRALHDLVGGTRVVALTDAAVPPPGIGTA
jgi:uncharacterized RDD family membrane protein YckC